MKTASTHETSMKTAHCRSAPSNTAENRVKKQPHADSADFDNRLIFNGF
jgi:hypothetical protein